MKFTDEGWLLSTNKFQESSAIINIFSKDHGLIRGFYKFSKNKSGFLPPVHVHFHYHSRLSEHLGSLKIEFLKSAAASFVFDRIKLEILTLALFLIKYSLNEFEEKLSLYHSFSILLNSLDDSADIVLKNYALFELELLQTSGFGLNTSRCILTNSTTNLKYLSPRTGNIVHLDAAGIYKDRLFAIPNFWHDQDTPSTWQDIHDSLRVTEYFISKRLLSIRNVEFPIQRNTIMQYLESELMRYKNAS